MMQLTTLARVKMYSPVSSTTYDGLINSQIAAVSARIESYLQRHVPIALRTETYNADGLARRFFLRGAPFYSTTASPQRRGGPDITVAADPTAHYSPLRDFSEPVEDTDQYYFRLEDGIVEFDLPLNPNLYCNPGSLRITGYSGMAYTLDQLAASSTAQGGTLTVGAAVTGSLSGATGVVLAYSSGVSITVRVLSGVFEVGEDFVDDANATNTAEFTAFGVTGAPLCMAYPEIVEAMNMQVSWTFQRRELLGITSFSVEGSTSSFEKSATLLVGVKEMLAPHVRFGVTY